jgi:hypothetical protein
MTREEFYVGYLPQAPAGLAALWRRVILGLLGSAAAIAAILVFSQGRFAASVFEFQQYRDAEGVLRTRPYPRLEVSAEATYLLAGPGKHGADDRVQGFDGRFVRLKGSLISRDGNSMLELKPGTLQASSGATESARSIDLGRVSVTGEIVDSKCYLGVMNPGSGKVHRDCAARCISGGVPPALVVRDAAGVSKTVLLAAPGRPLGREILQMVAEPVRVSGRLSRSGDLWLLEADAIRR